jgi:hypothetical protein
MPTEAETCLELFDTLRAEVVASISGLSPEALNWRPLEGTDEHATNSLAATFAHLTGSQRFWVGEAVGGQDAHRVREAEFRVVAGNAAELLDQLEATFGLVRQVLTTLPPGHLEGEVKVGQRTRTRRWALLHALEHTALHVGHMQLTRQLWEAR